MFLATRISRTQLANYRQEIVQCLKHNSSNVYISQIYVYTDDIDFKIFLPKVKIIFKKKLLNDEEIIIESKKTSKFNKIIISEPFIQFQEDLYKIVDEDLKKNIFQNLNYLIFSKNVKLTHNNRFELEIKHINLDVNKINVQRITHEKNNSLVNKKVLIKKSVYDPTYKKPTIRQKKLDVLIVSVNYNDYLLVSLINNIKIFENITVVTTKEDLKCQEICEKLEVNCVISERIYENGAKFNKGKAINDGIRSLVNPDLILLLDADIIVENEINLELLSDEILYTSDRIIYRDYNSYISKTNGTHEIDKGYGFFQLFCIHNQIINKEMPFPESSDTADGSDLVFRDYFGNNRRSINSQVIHLGDIKENWKGRKTNEFINKLEFENLLKDNTFDINQYFDKIYCLNLDRRPDRWEKVSEEFKKYNIGVERFSAIDGLKLSDEYFQKYNGQNLTEEKSSLMGILENKNALACLLSHLEILKISKESGYKKILIFEDDIIVSSNFIKKARKIKDIDWKLVYFGCSQFQNLNLEKIKDFYYSKNSLGTFGWAFDMSNYDELIELHNQNINKSIDNLLSIFQNNNYKKCFTFDPNIIKTDSNDSDIRNRKVLIKDFRDKNIVPKLAVITTFFNPQNYINLKYNYLKFSEKIKEKCDLFTIELSFDGNFFIEGDNVIKVEGDKNNILWQKERLLNILLSKLPKEYTNIAWIDCDILFENENWVDEVNENLKYYKVLHLFENAKRLRSDGSIGMVSKSIVKKTNETNQIEKNLSNGITGFAWAARREVLQKIKFLDTQIIGGADALMFFSFVGQKNTPIHSKMNQEWLDVYNKWFDKAFDEVGCSVNNISGDIIHLYHGDMKNRNYNDRYEILNSYNFNPKKDLIIDKSKLWKLKDDNISDKMSNYFESRDEDDNIIDINNYFDKIFVINLNRRKDRYKKIKTKLDTLEINFEKFSAIDGKYLKFDNSNFIQGKGMIENKYAYACLLSHLEIIKISKENNYKRILVFEDDVLISKNIKIQIQKLRELKKWKILNFGSSQYDWNVDFVDGFYLSKKTLGGFAYAIDEFIYDDLIELLEEKTKSFDNLLSELQNKYYGECFTFYPNICIADVTNSDIRENRDQKIHSEKMRWNILNDYI